ncbi:hypothetical protein G9409_03920 [Chlorobium sp. BLA1]|uniref:hypothetical protein n=1 Tax=Candidatus Chlorobium masyuteum TaxID=2716876 RepID=UPI0014208D93|nr:hypothetical protein [Candidatus Chlorobium masyuteum]NHQ59744.1 hypothetical protein [Candidatus Chlorobium masyuteum]NTU44974.1 hypothetical protein [Chlorobiaceae bacterium]
MLFTVKFGIVILFFISLFSNALAEQQVAVSTKVTISISESAIQYFKKQRMAAVKAAPDMPSALPALQDSSATSSGRRTPFPAFL